MRRRARLAVARAPRDAREPREPREPRGARNARGAREARARPARYERIGARLPGVLRAGASDRLAGRRLVFASAGCLTGLALAPMPSAIVASVLLAGCGWRLAGAADARAERARVEAVTEALPDALDLLAVCVIGGMGLDPALRRVSAATAGPLGESMRRAVNALDAGLPWGDALKVWSERAASPAVAAVVAAMRRAARYGSPLADTLAASAAEARAAACDRAREQALAAPVRMLFPLTLCFLPAFALLAIAPSLIVAIRSLGGGP
ncbi:MAG TPA: type II secretion system F family protein [Actinomycetota bacterium]|nr:type II secretion system F family protein [Actinomycetota bacterium]